MLAHPSDRKACKSKTTLIVCPVSLMTQWKDEIEKKADGRLRVLIHHGKGKAGASEFGVSRFHRPICSHLVNGDRIAQVAEVRRGHHVLPDLRGRMAESKEAGQQKIGSRGR